MRTTTILALATFLALGACYDAESEAELEGDAEAGEMEADVPVTAADTELGFATWDIDRSEALSAEEWDAWWADTDAWNEWDLDDELGLSGDEWGDMTHTLWDVDDDGAVAEAEWREATGRWYGDDVAYGAWADWDLDGGSELDANEVTEGLEREGLHDVVDRDDDLLIDDEELADWFFDVFDFDDDERIDVTEWDWGANYDFER